MKNLANCTPVEFLKQTNKIRHSVEGWLKETGVLEIKKNNKPQLIEITDSMSDEEREKAEKENRERLTAQLKKNVSDMLDKALDINAEKTVEVLALLCFIEPKDANSVKPTEYLKNVGEILSDKDVIDFFISLMRLEQTNILDFAKA